MKTTDAEAIGQAGAMNSVALPWYAIGAKPESRPVRHILMPFAQNLLVSFFYPHAALLSHGCYNSANVLQFCCEGSASKTQEEAGCFNGSLSFYVCCSDEGALDRAHVPVTLLHGWRENGTLAGVQQVWPLYPGAKCVVEASGHLAALHYKFRNCAAACHQVAACFRRCAERQLQAAHLENITLGTVDAYEESRLTPCWPRQKNWHDISVVLSSSLAFGRDDIVDQLYNSVLTLNTYIFEMNQMSLDKKQTAFDPRPSIAQFRFPPRPLGYPLQAVEAQCLPGPAKAHRGAVLERLTQELSLSKRDGLSFVELGVSVGNLSRFLVRELRPLLREVHLVDTFDPENAGGEFKPTLWSSAESILSLDLGYEECPLGVDAITWPHISLCSRLPLRRVVVHQQMSHLAAEAFADGSLDLVFVDASHLYPDVFADISAWWPKVAYGGILAGHDFRYKVGGVREAVSQLLKTEVFLDSDTVFWAFRARN